MLLKRFFLGFICGHLLAAGVAGASERVESLSLAVWGGSHLAMLQHAVFAPFKALTGAKLEPQTQSGGLHTELLATDVVELELQDAIEACDSGKLSLIPGNDLADYVPNALQPCAIGQYIWSTVFAYDSNNLKQQQPPTLISDFFNIQYYPGRRAVRRSSRVLSEWALLATGIPASRIYQTLDRTELAWSAIQQILDPIAHTIVWVDDDRQAMDLLKNGSVTFAMVGNDTLVREVVAGADSLQPVWDGAVNQMSLWGIPVTTKKPELAWKFVRYATSVDTARRFSAMSGYGPARYTSLEQINSNYHQYLPSTKANLANVVWCKTNWWRNKAVEFDQLFSSWLSGQVQQGDS